MTVDALRRLFDEAYVDVMMTAYSYPDISFIVYSTLSRMFKRVTNIVTIYDDPEFMQENVDILNSVRDKNKEELIEKFKNIAPNDTYLKCKKYFEENNISYIEQRYEEYAYIINENKEAILCRNKCSVWYMGPEPVLPDWIVDLLVFKEIDTKHRYKYLVYDPDEQGFSTMDLTMNPKEIDIDANYNDDLPDNKIREFLESDECGIIILHGEPGTGKSTYIRHLISNVDNEFLYLDQSSFQNITDATFIRTLIEHKNCVIILEDCENLIQERLSGGDSQIAALLNLTDGLLGDSFKFKVLCTFNTDLKNIDKALMRKGRLKIKYMFKLLDKDKTSKLMKKLGFKSKDIPKKDMSLAEIYSFGEVVNYNSEEKTTVGFNI